MIGQPAPAFSVSDVYDKDVVLAKRPEGYTLIAFLKYAGCPWCNLAIHRLALESKMLARNDCDVIVFMQATKHHVIRSTHKHHTQALPFPLVADPHMEVYRKYGVNRSIRAVVRAINDIPAWVHAMRDRGLMQSGIPGDVFLAQALFLVSRQTQTIVQALYGKSLYDHHTFTPIYESLVFKER